MPYNSSSFERELARLKAEKAVKQVEGLPLSSGDDAHMPKPQAKGVGGTVIPNRAARASAGEVIPNKNAPREPDDYEGPVIVRSSRKAFYKRGWFIFLAFSVLSTAAVPVFFGKETNTMLELASSMKASTGVDPFALKTYTNLLKHDQAAPETPQPATQETIVEQVQKSPSTPAAQPDTHTMQYIEQESKRVQDMARELDKKFNPPER